MQIRRWDPEGDTKTDGQTNIYVFQQDWIFVELLVFPTKCRISSGKALTRLTLTKKDTIKADVFMIIV